MDNENTQELPKSQEDIMFEDMNRGLDTIQATRESMITQLTQLAGTVKLNPEDDAPRKTEIKLGIFKTVDDLLRSQENLLTSKVKIGLQKKSEASNENLKQIAVEILKNIDMKQKKNTSAPVVVDEKDADKLRKVFAKMTDEDPNASIKEEELVMDEPVAT